MREIPGGLGVAFMTRRKEFLKIEMTKLRELAARGGLRGEQLDHVLNAVEMLSNELWEMQDAMAAMALLQKDVQAQITGLQRLSFTSEAIVRSAQKGLPMPEGGPEEIVAFFKKAESELM